MTASRSWASFAATQPGTRILNNQYDECVAVANRYHQGVRGLPFVNVRSAHEWWTRYGNLSALNNNYTRSQTPVPGAVVVWSGAGWNAQHGHIGVVVSVGKNGLFTTLEQNTAFSRWTTRITRSVRDAGLLGFLIPKGTNPAIPAKSKPKKGLTVKHYRRRDLNARPGKKGRTLKPGAGLYLNTKNSTPSQATNTVGGIGPYIHTTHVYGTGTPGDKITVKLLFSDTRKKPAARSWHFAQEFTVGPDGHFKENVTFQRAVSRGFAVYVHVSAVKTNKSNVKLTMLDSDAYLIQ